jgi:F0F1-type ATP synthase membrane subunit c/vacuolar-type H+-ATPase subunit K
VRIPERTPMFIGIGTIVVIVIIVLVVMMLRRR